MAKCLLDDFTPVQVALMRYGGALFAYLLFVLFAVVRGKRWKDFFLIPSTWGDALLLFLMGFLPFCFSPLAQLTGLSQTLASENAVMIAMEPLLTAFLAWSFLKEKVNLFTLVALFQAFVGFLLLSGLTSLSGSELSGHSLGNLWILISLMGEASFTVIGRRLTGKYRPAPIFGSALLVGVLSLALSTGLWRLNLNENPSFQSVSYWKAIGAVFWLGPLGTTAAYLYWTFALVEVPVMLVSLVLFLQPVAGAVWGYFLLGDRMTFQQNIGSVLILLAVLLSLRFKIETSDK